MYEWQKKTQVLDYVATMIIRYDKSVVNNICPIINYKSLYIKIWKLRMNFLMLFLLRSNKLINISPLEQMFFPSLLWNTLEVGRHYRKPHLPTNSV
jgi:hypothetical protein